MSLPKIQYPIFELVLPSDNSKINYRPFTVKEEKILLIAQESEDISDKLRAIRQIINNCCLNLKKDVDNLSSFDIEYIFINIRSKSVGNIVELAYRDNDDGKVYKFQVNLDEVKVEFNNKHTNTIELSNSLGLKMNYPSIEILNEVKLQDNNSQSILKLIGQCIDIIYDEETTYNPKEYSEDELNEFIDSISAKDFEKIVEFFDTMPSLRYTLNYKDSTGTEKTIILQGIDDFFQ